MNARHRLLNLATALMAGFAAFTTAAAAQSTDDQGCYAAPRDCIDGQIRWLENGRTMSMRMTNTCRGRLYVRFCNKLANGSDDCGAASLAPGRTKVWSSSNADKRGIGGWRYVGSSRPSNDWVCAGKSPSFDASVY